MSQEIIQAFLATCEAVGTAALGGVAAVIITHRLNVDRERINGIAHRRRAFLAFLAGWRYEINRTKLVVGGFEGREETFGDVISTFVQESSLIKWDLNIKKRI